MKAWIGELYLAKNGFRDEANQTIGAPLVGQNFEKIFLNRRSVTGKLTDAGKQALVAVAERINKEFGVTVTFGWSTKTGCSMCPCSPGFKIFFDSKHPGRRSTEEKRMRIWVDEDGKIDFRFAKYGGFAEYATLENMKKEAVV
jgi:hypothetical protein